MTFTLQSDDLVRLDDFDTHATKHTVHNDLIRMDDSSTNGQKMDGHKWPNIIVNTNTTTGTNREHCYFIYNQLQ